MILTFFTKILISSVQFGASRDLDETFSYKREAVCYIGKVYHTAIGEITTLVSVVFLMVFSILNNTSNVTDRVFTIF